MDPRVMRAWTALPGSQRLAVVIAAVLLPLVAMVAWSAARDTRVPLYPVALRPEQVEEVSESLALWGIAHVPTADNVRVDGRTRDATLLRLAIAGIPHRHVVTSGDALAGLGALTPQSVIDAQAREGLSGDISMALRGIDGVADARVIIAPAQRGLYADEPAHDATASVWLALRPGALLPAAAIAGMRTFVANAVPGLTREHVTIVDENGLALHDDAARTNAPAASTGTASTPRAAGTRRWVFVYGAIVAIVPALATAMTIVGLGRMSVRPLSVFARAFARRLLIDRARATPDRVPADVRRSLDGEPPYAAAAVISALPAATAAAVLDLYPAADRAAIVRRMSRIPSPLVREVTHHGA